MRVFQRDLPFRALALWTVLVPGLGALGIIIASWILPTIIALELGGTSGLGHIRREWYVFAHAPTWIDPVRDAEQYKWVDIGSLVLAMPSVVFFAVRAERLWRYLALKKLHWVTEEQLERFKNKQQYM